MICDAPDLAADPDLEPVEIVVAAVALVATDATDRNTCELFEIGDNRTEGWVAVQRLGVPKRRRLTQPARALSTALRGRFQQRPIEANAALDDRILPGNGGFGIARICPRADRPR